MANKPLDIPFLDLEAVNRPLAPQLTAAAASVVTSGRYLRSSQTEAFEEAYAAYIGTRHCVGCGNGLDALTLMLVAAQQLRYIPRRCKVIVPANTYIATIIAISRAGLQPLLVEPDTDTLQISPEAVARAITPDVGAIMLVHLYGTCAYTPEIADMCRQHHIAIFEDNAQAHGCRQLIVDPHKLTGSLGLAAAHSFYPTKNLGALGDAGAVTTDHADLADRIRALANYGSDRHYIFPYRGVNSRLDEVQAAILNVKLPHLNQWNDHRRAIAQVYRDTIRSPYVTIPTHERDSVYHLFPVLTPHRDALRAHLLRQSIGTDIHYPIPPHQQRSYARLRHQPLPVTEQLSQQILSLPCNTALTLDQARRVAQAVNDFNP